MYCTCDIYHEAIAPDSLEFLINFFFGGRHFSNLCVLLVWPNLLTYMRVFGFGQKTLPSQDGCINHCNVGFPWYYDQRWWSSMIYFFIYILLFEVWSQTWMAPMHWDRNKYDCFNNLIEMIVEVCEIAQFTRATPGSSLVYAIWFS